MESVVIFILFSLGVSLLGKKRHIGVKWAFILSFFLSPIIGLIIVLFSKKISSEKKHSKIKSNIGIVLMVLMIMSFLGQIMHAYRLSNFELDIFFLLNVISSPGIYMAIGLGILGYYLNKSGQGISFRLREIKKQEITKEFNQSQKPS